MREREGTPEPAFLTARATASVLSVSTKTLYRWLAAGTLQGVRIPTHRAWYESQRRTERTHWRVSLASVVALLTASYDGGKVPRSLVMRLRRLAKPAPHPHVGQRGTPQ